VAIPIDGSAAPMAPALLRLMRTCWLLRREQLLDKLACLFERDAGLEQDLIGKSGFFTQQAQ
jgi:hypothetical protein